MTDIHTDARQPYRLIPVTKWNKYHEWPPPGGLRHLIFHAKARKNSRGEVISGNGLERSPYTRRAPNLDR